MCLGEWHEQHACHEYSGMFDRVFGPSINVWTLKLSFKTPVCIKMTVYDNWRTIIICTFLLPTNQITNAQYAFVSFFRGGFALHMTGYAPVSPKHFKGCVFQSPWCFLAHLSQRLKWTIAVRFRPSSVNFLHFHLLLLENAWLDFNQTWQKSSLGGRGFKVVQIVCVGPDGGPGGGPQRAKTMQISNIFFSRSRRRMVKLCSV